MALPVFPLGFYYLLLCIGNPDVLGNGLKREEEEEREREVFVHTLLTSAWKIDQRAGTGLHGPNIGKNGRGKSVFFFFHLGPQNQCARRMRNREINHCALMTVREAPQASHDKHRHWNCFHTDKTICKPFQKKVHVNISQVRGQLMRSNPRRSSAASLYMLSVMGFDQKGTISKVRVHVGLYLDILKADRSPNAADSPRSSPDRSITMVKLKRKS